MWWSPGKADQTVLSLFSTILLATFILTLLLRISKGREIDPTSFNTLFLLLCLAEIPYLSIVALVPGIVHPAVYSAVSEFEFTFFKYVLLKCLFILSFLVGASSLKNNRAPQKKQPSKSSHFYFTSFVCLGIALVALAFFLEAVGGSALLLRSWHDKTLTVQGTGLLRNVMLVYFCLSVGFFIAGATAESNHNKTIKYSGVGLLILVAFSALTMGGERKNPYLLIVYALLMWHFCGNQLKLLGLRNVFVFVGLLAYAAVVPVLRTQDGLGVFLDDPLGFLVLALPYTAEIFKYFSGIETALYILSTFTTVSDTWFYSTLPDFFTGFIPSGMYPNKPPIDEGVYIYNLAQGGSFDIPTPFTQLTPVGWPLSRMMGPYVHLFYPGVFIFGILTGVFVKYFYILSLRSSFSPEITFIYVWTMFVGFGFTNAFVFNLLIMLVVVSPVFFARRLKLRSRI